MSEGDHEAETGFVIEKFTLIQVTLGMEPYTLITVEAASDGSGEPVLLVQAGGGAEDNPLELPMLLITECPPDKSRVAETLRKLADENAEGYYRQAIDDVTREFNPDWLPFVFRTEEIDDGRAHAGLGLLCQVCDGECVIDEKQA